MSDCYHCGLPALPDFSSEINGVNRQFCCPGCQAITETIYGSGLGQYYQYREQPSVKAAEKPNNYAVYDLPEVQKDFVFDDESLQTAKLAVGGVSCAACAWLIENQLSRLPGLESVRVNASTRQAFVRWEKGSIALSEIFTALDGIGYQPSPAQNRESQKQREKESRTALMRLGLAGLGMMQVGMVAIALYAGGEDMSPYWQGFLRWVSLLMATPVILFSAQPFFYSAYRSLRNRHLNMDVPVALALLLAFSASTWATVKNSGDVYFDSVSMFTFFLLLGRFLEMRARHSSAFENENLSQLLPLSANKIGGNQTESQTESQTENKTEIVPLSAVKPGDHIWVDAGAVVPADGKVLSEHASIDESLLTGESEWKKKAQDSTVLAGTLNGDTAFSMVVQACGHKTQLAAIEKLVLRAEMEKPLQQSLADKLAGKFVAAVLLVSIVVAAFWWWRDPSQVIWVVLSVLVVTCPCALALATPAALTVGTKRCREQGLMVLSAHVLEGLDKVKRVIFDKTGTLTEGELKLVDVRTLQTLPEDPKLIVAALEKHSQHPIARAFLKTIDSEASYICKATEDVKVYGSEGVAGCVCGRRYRFGKPSFCQKLVKANESLEDKHWRFPGDGIWQLLVNENGPVAWFKFSDPLRESAIDTIKRLRKNSKTVALLSGDREENVATMANTLNIDTWVANADPQKKLEYVREFDSDSGVTLMVGDGINDIPVLSRAELSIAMGSATQLAQTHADAVLLSGDLSVIPEVMSIARRVKSIIKQNLCWAIIYNLIALPAAVSGLIPPWLAAIGMSLSSLVVVCNAMRV